jgi:hypothetical protein
MRTINVEKRLGFAHSNIEKYHLDNTRFDRILWSDETSVTCFPKAKKIALWVHSSVPIDDRPTAPTVKNGEFSVMFWGRFSKGAWGQLVEVQGIINGQKYLELLQNVIEP